MSRPDVEHTEGEQRRPVTKAALAQAANAGYASEVLRGWQLMGEEALGFAEGMALVQTAFAVSAQMLDAEADTARGLASQSDEPEWRKMFTDKEALLRARAQSKRQGISAMGEAVKNHQESTQPRDIDNPEL